MKSRNLSLEAYPGRKRKLPPWLKKRWPISEIIDGTEALLKTLNLRTVCQSARCPNQGECFSAKKATFMVLGNVCTRNCRFCAVEKKQPLSLDPEEPRRVAEASFRLGLKHVVITSVTRDDLTDGGARHFRDAILEVCRLLPRATVEALTPDFQGSLSSLKTIILEGHPHIFNHNLETVPRLYPRVRPEADYQRSLDILRMAKELDGSIYTKSGLMVGLGETKDEVIQTMKDLRKVNCGLLTIGQYLSPSRDHLPVKDFIAPDLFEEYGRIGEEMGFSSVASSPFVRSSYNAERQFARVKSSLRKTQT
ncbi:lipoyl synthase [candidate division NPL-UPA2 bacterium]|nr:lipoyl synthase [candidate division NPL-UPA2 bacterium]